MSRTAASMLREALENVGVKYTFGIPGVHNTEIYDELARSDSITPVLVTHEGAGAFMADAVSRSGTSLGTLVIVPAAGVTHAASGIGEAFLDGIPMLVIAGGVRRDTGRKYQLHDMDQHALLKPITKGTWLVEKHADVIPTIYEAVRVATSGEPGPVFVEIPVHLQLLTGDEGPAVAAPVQAATPVHCTTRAGGRGRRIVAQRQVAHALRRLGRRRRHGRNRGACGATGCAGFNHAAGGECVCREPPVACGLLPRSRCRACRRKILCRDRLHAGRRHALR